MEVFIPHKTARCPNINISCGSSTTDPHNVFHNKEDLSLFDFKECLNELQNIEEAGISTSCFNLVHEKNDDIVNLLREFKCKDLQKSPATGFSASGKCIRKYTTFQPPSGPKISGDVFVDEKEKHELDITAEVSEGNGAENTSNQCYSRSTPLPVSFKLVSALKGGREKQHQGTPLKKLSVTWAPDVYDPIPTSVSHVPSDKNQRYRYGKKKGKYKQKSSGKSSRGSKSKEKKQGRKSSGGSSKLKHHFYVDDLAVLGESRVGILDYNVGSPDPFCGSSLLKESVTKLHFRVAGAT